MKSITNYKKIKKWGVSNNNKKHIDPPFHRYKTKYSVVFSITPSAT